MLLATDFVPQALCSSNLFAIYYMLGKKIVAWGYIIPKLQEKLVGGWWAVNTFRLKL